MTALLVFTDGRGDCLRRTLTSFTARLHGTFDSVTIIDDSGSIDYARSLREDYSGGLFTASWHPGSFHIHSHPWRHGFAGAIQSGWRAIPKGTDYVFHLEDDFVLDVDVELASLVGILDDQPDVAQVALKRQAWNEEEQAAGGIVELHPDCFDLRETAFGPITVHRRFFTTNPSLYRVGLVDYGWPAGTHSEGRFTHYLMSEEPTMRFAFRGAPFDPPIVTHIGAERVGTGY